MTKRRLEYLKGCSVVERFCREELRLAAKKIKMYKQDITGRIKRIAEFDESEEYNIKICTDLLRINKGFLKIEQAKYKAIKKLLPQRKPVKKVKVLNSEMPGYWKFKRTSNGVKTGQCSICGGYVAGKSFKFIDNFYNFCPNCDNPMKPRRWMQ